MSEAPAEVWLRPSCTWDHYFVTVFPDQPDAVRYVRADLYEAESVNQQLVGELGKGGRPR